MECKVKWILRDLATFLWDFGLRVYVMGMGCRPMGLPMSRPIL
jgi:hypothetical protein